MLDKARHVMMRLKVWHWGLKGGVVNEGKGVLGELHSSKRVTLLAEGQ